MKRALITVQAVLFAFAAVTAQTPEHYPPPVPEPVAPTLFNIILYLVIPLILYLFYRYYRHKKRKGGN